MILVVSYPGEDHAIEVIKRLENKGHEVVLFDLADFPAANEMSFYWREGKKDPSFIINHKNGQVELAKLKVAWWRRIRPFVIDPAITNPSTRAFASSETSQALNGVLDSLSCKWVNARGADDAAHHKPFQWTAAQQLGLKVPRTLVTNKPENALQFIREMGVQKTVFKAFLASLDAWRETRLVEEEDLKQIESVRYAPVIFQEYIKGIDLRITIIGNKVFAAQIDAQKTSYPVDMRMVIGETEIKSFVLPDKIINLLLRLQKRLGIDYGAVDMRVTPEGEYFFLEVNPAGQWLFVEQRTGLPISQAVADFLANFDK